MSPNCLLDCELAPEPLGRLLKMLHDELAAQHGRARRSLAGNMHTGGLLQWAQHYLPAHLNKPPSSMHRWLAKQLDRMTHARGGRLNVLGPRGSAKSTIATLAYPLREALEAREPYIWIVSDTRPQACAHLENLKAELADNPRIAADYPDASRRGPTWRTGCIVLGNGVTIEAFGTGQRIRGRRRRANRPTLILCDDLENDGHMQSSLLREHSRTWFHGALLQAGTNRTNIVNLATALHREALALRLHETPGWTSRIFRAIQRWPQSMALWHAWESLYTNLDVPNCRDNARAFYEEHRQAMDSGATVLWPQHEDLYSLMCLRSETGRASFEREKQNCPIAPDLCEWPETYFDETIWFDRWPDSLQVRTLALDPSKGTDSQRGDYSALVQLGVDRRGVLYVDADLARRNTSQIVADSVAHYRQFRPDAFGIEANQFQELLGAEFQAELARQAVLGVQPWLLDNRVNKLVRIRRLGPYLAAKRVRFKTGSPGTQLLVNQLKEFPIGDHDDGPDALEMAIRMATELLTPVAPDDGLGNRLPVDV